MKRLKSNRGFTLLEILVGLGIAVLVIAIAIPAIGSLRESAVAGLDRQLQTSIESAAMTAERNEIPYDEPVGKEYRVGTLLDAGVLSVDDMSKVSRDAWVARKGDEFVYTGVRKPADASHFEIAPMSQDVKFRRHLGMNTGTPIENVTLNTYTAWPGQPAMTDKIEGYEITGYNGPSNVDLVIPGEIDGKKIVSIGENAFGSESETNPTYKRVYLPEGLEVVKKSAFDGIGLEAVYLPKTLKFIGIYSFKSNNLTEISLPDGIKVIGDCGFCRNSLQSLVVPDSMDFIETYAFSVNEIKDLRLPKDLKRIYHSGFSRNNIERVDFPPSLEMIGAYTFEQNQLKSVTIPNSVEEIEGRAFRMMPTLESIRFPDRDRMVIGSAAFTQSGLKEVVFHDYESLEIEDSAFRDNSIEHIDWGGSDTITVGINAFRANSLKRIELPSGVREIGSYSFYDNQLERIDFPDRTSTLNMVVGSWVFAINNLGEVNGYVRATSANTGGKNQHGWSLWNNNPNPMCMNTMKKCS